MRDMKGHEENLFPAPEIRSLDLAAAFGVTSPAEPGYQVQAFMAPHAHHG